MKTLHISISDKIATYRQRDGEIVCGNSDYQIEFTFDAEWASYSTKTARFIVNGRYEDVEFTGTTCPVPIITNATEVMVGVYAGNLCTTTPATISCKLSILCPNIPAASAGVAMAMAYPEGAAVMAAYSPEEATESYNFLTVYAHMNASDSLCRFNVQLCFSTTEGKKYITTLAELRDLIQKSTPNLVDVPATGILFDGVTNYNVVAVKVTTSKMWLVYADLSVGDLLEYDITSAENASVKVYYCGDTATE